MLSSLADQRISDILAPADPTWFDSSATGFLPWARVELRLVGAINWGKMGREKAKED
jgi:hypothetical protein